MRLRNKKTGGVFDAIVREKSNDNGKYSIIVCNTKAIRNRESSFLGEYDSLDELNEEWEDYEPVEPLIKDEKIRKAIRAWAEANGVERVFVGNSNNELVAKFSRKGQKISFGSSLLLDRGRNFTIIELCGEEECEN